MVVMMWMWADGGGAGEVGENGGKMRWRTFGEENGVKMAGRCLCSVFLSHFGSLGGSFSKIVREIVPKSCAKSLEIMGRF